MRERESERGENLVSEVGKVKITKVGVGRWEDKKREMIARDEDEKCVTEYCTVIGSEQEDKLTFFN